jgi:hypothetical protein
MLTVILAKGIIGIGKMLESPNDTRDIGRKSINL